MKNTDVFLILDDFISKIKTSGIIYRSQVISEDIKKYLQ